MKRFILLGCLLAVSLGLASCGGEQMVWEPAVEQSTFAEIDQALPAVREAIMDLNDTINRRITTKRYKDEALEQLKGCSDFVDKVQFYYLPILNARAHIARAYREVGYGMYAEASEDIKKAVDNINKAALKSTDTTRIGFEEVKRGLVEVTEISDATKDSSRIKLTNAAKKLNHLIEKVRPTVVVTEEGESLIDGQF
jgi:hypothetical protein